jgi:hypothetical protein
MPGNSPIESALLLALILGRLRQPEPFLGDSQPRLFIERANDARGVLSGFLSLLAESGCFVGHDGLMHKIQNRPLLISN